MPSEEEISKVIYESHLYKACEAEYGDCGIDGEELAKAIRKLMLDRIGG